jgi:hypothetical protein
LHDAAGIGAPRIAASAQARARRRLVDITPFGCLDFERRRLVGRQVERRDRNAGRRIDRQIERRPS